MAARARPAVPDMQKLVSLDARPRRYGFALTPLADAMFQLLVFFMLSSSLSPYSLIPLAAQAAEGSGELDTAPVPQPEQTPDPEAAPPAVWHLARGQIRIGQDSLPLESLPAEMPRLLADAENGVLLFPGRASTVQDVATVLEITGRFGISRVQLVALPGRGG
jgi:biopolymer transport protein ExbD